MKKILTILLTIAMLSTMAVVPVGAEQIIPSTPGANTPGQNPGVNTPSVELPTATVAELDVTEIQNPKLTFAMKFKADDVTSEQLEAYGNWYADYELTVNKNVTLNCNAGDEGVVADGYLAGQYDNWSADWVSVPMGNDTVTLTANEPLKIMEDVAQNKLTYSEVCDGVQEFNCGMFLTDEFLAANPDVEVTLELRIYKPDNEEKSYVIGDTYTFEIDLPTATVTELDVTEIQNPELTFAMKFKADEAEPSQLAAFGSWYADYELTVNKNVTLNCNAGDEGVVADGYLAGQYDNWSADWVSVPMGNDTVTLTANEPLKIMESVAQNKLTYSEVYEGVQEFNCGMFLTDEFLAANPDLTVTLEFRIYNAANENINYRIGDEAVFEMKAVTPGENTGSNVSVHGTTSENSVNIVGVAIQSPTDSVVIDTNDFVAENEVIDTVSLPASVASDANISEDATVEIVLAGEDADIKLTINKDALDAINDKLTEVDDGAQKLIIVVDEKEDNELTPNQQDTVSTLSNATVYKISIVTDTGREVYSSENTTNEDTRNITVEIYYEKSGIGDILVNHLTDNGSLENVEFTYNNSIVSLELSHFSEYVIHTEKIYRPVSSGNKYYEVKFETDGGTYIKNQSIATGKKVNKPQAPVKEGFIFDGWYEDKALTKEYNFGLGVTSSFTLYAKWKLAFPFTDVANDKWYYDSIFYVYQNEIMNGTTDTLFAPDKNLTRAMLVTVLYRMEDVTVVNKSIPFADIDMGSYYADAVIWAKQNNIVNGVTDNKFMPDKDITREQVAAIMYRYAQYKGYDVSAGESTDILSFKDANSISEYAVTPMKYAVGAGIINGKSSTGLYPKDNTTRAEIAAIIFRFIGANK